MQPPKWLCAVTMTVLVFQSTGCYSHRALSRPSPGTYNGVRVTTTSGQRIELVEVHIDSLTIAGSFRKTRGRVEIPLQNVETLEERHFSVSKTGGLVVLISAGVFVGVAALIGYGVS